jgi:hypothetical protein
MCSAYQNLLVFVSLISSGASRQLCSPSFNFSSSVWYLIRQLNCYSCFSSDTPRHVPPEGCQPKLHKHVMRQHSARSYGVTTVDISNYNALLLRSRCAAPYCRCRVGGIGFQGVRDPWGDHIAKGRIIRGHDPL